MGKGVCQKISLEELESCQFVRTARITNSQLVIINCQQLRSYKQNWEGLVRGQRENWRQQEDDETSNSSVCVTIVLIAFNSNKNDFSSVLVQFYQFMLLKLDVHVADDMLKEQRWKEITASYVEVQFIKNLLPSQPPPEPPNSTPHAGAVGRSQ